MRVLRQFHVIWGEQDQQEASILKQNSLVPPTGLTFRDVKTNATFEAGDTISVVNGKQAKVVCRTSNSVTSDVNLLWETISVGQSSWSGKHQIAHVHPWDSTLFIVTATLAFTPRLADNEKDIICVSSTDMPTSQSISAGIKLDVHVVNKALIIRDLTTNKTLRRGQKLQVQENILRSISCETDRAVKPPVELIWDVNLSDKQILEISQGTRLQNSNDVTVFSYTTLTFQSDVQNDEASIICANKGDGMINENTSVDVTLSVEVPAKVLILRDPLTHAIYQQNDTLQVKAGTQITLTCETDPPVKPNVDLFWNTSIAEIRILHDVPTKRTNVPNTRLEINFITLTFTPTAQYNGKSLLCSTFHNHMDNDNVWTLVTFDVTGNDHVLETTIAVTGGLLVVCVACGIVAVCWYTKKRNGNTDGQQEGRAIAPASPPVIRLRALPPIPQPQSPQLLSLSPARGQAGSTPSIASNSCIRHPSLQSPIGMGSTSFTRHTTGAETEAKAHLDDSSEDYADLKDDFMPYTKSLSIVKKRRIPCDEYAAVNKTKSRGQKIRHILTPSASGMDEYAIPDKTLMSQCPGGQTKDSTRILTQPTHVSDMEYAAIGN